MRAGDELHHQIKLASQQQGEDYGPFVYGHVSTYDPKTHSVRLIFPSMRDEDDNPILSAWMPLGTMLAGNGYGFQAAPMGGATLQNPTLGELCKVSRFDRTLGVGVIDGMMFNQVNLSPVQNLAGGEIAVYAFGSFFRFYADKHIEFNSQAAIDITAVGNVNLTTQASTVISSTGDVDITTQGALNATVTGAASINATGNCTVSSGGALALNATGTLSLTGTSATAGAGGTVQKLLTALAALVYNGHTHSVPGGAGTSGVPNQLMTSADETSVLEAQ
jgi:hypothetical protein